jgi:DNA-binding response OmpR family regulator
MKILVLDDESIVLDSCKRVLTAEGFSVQLVDSVDEALRMLEGDPFDLLLVDVKMPKRDGMFFVRKARESWPRVPIILMSGFPTAETMAEGARSGATTFIPKPFTPDELLQTIRNVLRKEPENETHQGPGH